MVTIERILQVDGVDFSSLEKKPFTKSDVSNEMTDINVSMKLIDSFGNVVMLIEAMGIDIYPDDDSFGKKGCLVGRFEFVEGLINTHHWNDFLKSFLTSIRYSMIPCDNGHFLGRYKYIWAQKEEGQQCVIAEALGLKEFIGADEFIVYKRDVPS